MNTFKLIVSLCCFVALSACQRDSTTSDTITFNGIVYLGHKDSTSGGLILDGRISGATVTCDGSPGSVKTIQDGSYSLAIETVRLFEGQNSDIYTLQASYYGRSEKITVNGKPGDTINVRDFVIYQHTTEE